MKNIEWNQKLWISSEQFLFWKWTFFGNKSHRYTLIIIENCNSMPLASLSDKRNSWSEINHLDSSYSIHIILVVSVFVNMCVFIVFIVNICVKKREYAIILIPNDPIENWATNNAKKKCLCAICFCLYLCAILISHERDGESAKKEINTNNL